MTKNFFKKNYPLIRAIELVLDLFFIIFSFLFVVQLKEFITSGDFFQSIDGLFSEFFTTYMDVVRTQILYIIIVMLLFLVYQVTATRKSYGETMTSAILALVMSNMILIVISVLMSRSFVSPDVVMYTLLSQIIIFAIYKFAFHKVVSKMDKRVVLIIGPKEEATLIATKFLMEKYQRRNLKYILFEKLVDNSEDIIDYIRRVDDVIIAQGLNEQLKNNIMTYCLSRKYTNVFLIPKLYEINIVNSKVDQIRDTPVFVSQSLHLTLTQRLLKRGLDIAISLSGLILSFPLLIIVSILIKAQDKGPVFYKQERVTRNNQTFMLYKFRTMIEDAEKNTGAVWQMENDPRITKIGKFFRATRIDELPQLINVLKGDMSLIGPRPEREIFIQQFVKEIPDFKYRVNVKPGITGLAQVQGKYNSEPIDKLRFDLIYIRNYSIWLDFKILFLTVKAVFDRDASATLGIPKFEAMLEKHQLDSMPFNLGIEFKKKPTIKK